MSLKLNVRPYKCYDLKKSVRRMLNPLVFALPLICHPALSTKFDVGGTMY